MSQKFRHEVAVDILIRGWNNLDLTRKCLASIQGNTEGVKYRITYVDNGSEDKEALLKLIEDYPEVQFITLPFNHGSVRAINIGLAMSWLSEAPYILLLDNDTEVPAGDTKWLERFITYFDDEQVGAAGAMTDYVSGFQNYASAVPTYQKAWQVDGEGAGMKGPVPVSVLVSYAMMLRKEAVEQVGFFDEVYEPGNSEDYDYVLQLRDAGWKAVIANSVWIHHKGSQTFKQFNFKSLLETNHDKMIQKWGIPKLKEMGLIQ